MFLILSSASAAAGSETFDVFSHVLGLFASLNVWVWDWESVNFSVFISTFVWVVFLL